MRYLSFYFLAPIFSLMFVNLLGSFCMGFFSQMLLSQEAKLLFLVGFLGSFTTFSALSAEILRLLQNHQILFAFIYLLSMLFFGISSVWLGMILSKALFL